MGTNLRRDARNESAIQFMMCMKAVREEVEASLKKANQTMKDNYDHHRKASPDFKPGANWETWCCSTPKTCI